MSRKKLFYGRNRHHCYTRKVRCDKTEEKYQQIKFVDMMAHRNWHQLCGDMSPEEAIGYIAHNFMPTDYETKLLGVIENE